MKEKIKQYERVELTPPKMGRPAKYNFADMKVNDTLYANASVASLSSCARSWAKVNNSKFKFTTRKEGKGARIWRIK